MDLLIENKNKILFGIECKYKTNLTTKDLSGIRSFKEVYPNVPCYIVAPVEHPQKIDDVKIFSPEDMINKIMNKL